jgi:hypothetical protein
MKENVLNVAVVVTMRLRSLWSFLASGLRARPIRRASPVVTDTSQACFIGVIDTVQAYLIHVVDSSKDFLITDGAIRKNSVSITYQSRRHL